MNARIALALGASLALHAAALGVVAWSQIDAGPSAAPASRSVMRVRVVPADLPQVAQPSVTAPVDTALMDPAAAPPKVAAPQAGTPQAASPQAAAPQVAAALPPAPAMPLAAASAASRPVPGPDGLAGFVPASQLSVKPVPISVGDLEPAWLSQIKGAAIATVSVYVAADGSVFHVEVRQASDPRIAELARSAFAQARYRPGVMAGKNVAARVDISLDYQDSRDRVLDANAARPGSNVLKPHEIGPAFQPPPDNAPVNPKVEK